MKLKFNWYFGFIGFLGFLGYSLNEPTYYAFFAFFLFFLEPVLRKSKKEDKWRDRMKWKMYLRFLAVALLLYVFYTAGMPAGFIVVIGGFLILLILLRGVLYRNIDEALVKRFSFVRKMHPWTKKVLIIAIFIVIYVMLKQTVFFALNMAGIDVQQMIIESINASMMK